MKEWNRNNEPFLLPDSTIDFFDPRSLDNDSIVNSVLEENLLYSGLTGENPLISHFMNLNV